MGLRLAAHLPLVQFDDGSPITRDRILETVETAARLGFWGVSANDHVIFSRPWIDGPSALAMAIPRSAEMRVHDDLPADDQGTDGPREDAHVAERPRRGRLVAGIGPGSSPRDYAAAGVPFEQRWKRFDEAARILRRIFHGEEREDGRVSGRLLLPIRMVIRVTGPPDLRR